MALNTAPGTTDGLSSVRTVPLFLYPLPNAADPLANYSAPTSCADWIKGAGLPPAKCTSYPWRVVLDLLPVRALRVLHRDGPGTRRDPITFLPQRLRAPPVQL